MKPLNKTVHPGKCLYCGEFWRRDQCERGAGGGVCIWGASKAGTVASCRLKCKEDPVDVRGTTSSARSPEPRIIIPLNS